jgi:DNA-binding response OmpR family regulator
LRLLHAALPTGDDYLAHALSQAGHVVHTATDLADLLLISADGGFDAVLIEASEPSAIPVRRVAEAVGDGVLALVVATATAAERALTLRDGADACFIRPVHFMELEARLSALARLAPRPAPPEGALWLDPSGRAAHMAGRVLKLSMREYALLNYLAGRAAEVVSAEQILDDVWGVAGQAGTQRVRNTVTRLRVKLASTFGDPLIATVRGHGYRFDINMKLSSSG